MNIPKIQSINENSNLQDDYIPKYTIPSLIHYNEVPNWDKIIAAYALRARGPLTLREIFRTRSSTELKKFTKEAICTQFAGRIKHIEDFYKYKESPLMVNVRQIYLESFKEMYLCNTCRSLEFMEIIYRLKLRHVHIVPNLVSGASYLMGRYPNILSVDNVDVFLDRFFIHRIGTEMLTSKLLSPEGVLSESDPSLVVNNAVEDAKKLCYHHYDGKICPDVIVDAQKTALSYIPNYLYYILLELLKNSLRAVAQKKLSFQHEASQPINKSIVNDDANSSIRVSMKSTLEDLKITLTDTGGGIIKNHLSKIWSYMYTTARPVLISNYFDKFSSVSNEVVNNGSLEASAFKALPVVNASGASPLAGFGCGLPLSRLYTHYMGGDLKITSNYGYGTTATLILKRADNIDGFVSLTPVSLVRKQ